MTEFIHGGGGAQRKRKQQLKKNFAQATQTFMGSITNSFVVNLQSISSERD